MCGADDQLTSGEKLLDGSPPRVRSRRRYHPTDGGLGGITSACAEQTSPAHPPCSARGITSACAEQTRWTTGLAPRRWDHLRVCGADPASSSPMLCRMGSPPRVRSRPPNLRASCYWIGITSACAEQTHVCDVSVLSCRDHLRVCGADSCILLCSEPAEWCGIFDLRIAQGELMP